MSEEEGSHPDGVEIVEEDEVEQLKKKVAELEQEIQYYVADISNLRQKAAKERSQAIRFGSASLAKKILPLLSGMERAISHIESMGKQFDPTKMEAVAMLPAPDGIDPGAVIEVIEEGYMLHDRILRASRVIVADSDENE